MFPAFFDLKSTFIFSRLLTVGLLHETAWSVEKAQERPVFKSVL